MMTTATREDYLKRIFVQQQKADGDVQMGELATQLGVSGASVTGMVKSLVDSGLVEYQRYKGVQLTDEGRRIAVGVIRRHRLIELFLVETLSLDWSTVHDEAERLEHAVSDTLLARIDEFLGHPTVDPHGDPIPAADGEVRRRKLDSLADHADGDRVRVVRVVDQDPPFLQFIDRIGLRPGVEVAVMQLDAQAETITVQPSGGEPVTLARGAAAKLWVEPV